MMPRTNIATGVQLILSGDTGQTALSPDTLPLLMGSDLSVTLDDRHEIVEQIEGHLRIQLESALGGDEFQEHDCVRVSGAAEVAKQMAESLREILFMFHPLGFDEALSEMSIDECESGVDHYHSYRYGTAMLSFWGAFPSELQNLLHKTVASLGRGEAVIDSTFRSEHFPRRMENLVAGIYGDAVAEHLIASRLVDEALLHLGDVHLTKTPHGEAAASCRMQAKN